MANLNSTIVNGNIVVSDKIIKSGGTANDVLMADGHVENKTLIKVNGVNKKVVELTDELQSQLNSKMPTAGGTFTGTVSFGTGSLNTNGNVVCTHLKVSNIDAAQNSNAFATVDGGWVKYRNKADVKNDLGINNKQDKLTAGPGITIAGNTISTIGEDKPFTDEEVRKLKVLLSQVSISSNNVLNVHGLNISTTGTFPVWK